MYVDFLSRGLVYVHVLYPRPADQISQHDHEVAVAVNERQVSDGVTVSEVVLRFHEL